MKLVFPILRMNWYRVLATTIDAALAAGHEVECWHSTGENHWASNRPNTERLPRFIHGAPAVFDYDSDSAFLQLLTDHSPDAVLSLCNPWSNAVCDHFQPASARPLWVTVATNDSFIGVTTPERMSAISMIVLRTQHEKACLIDDHTADVRALLSRIEAEPGLHGPFHLNLIRDRLQNPWSTAMIDHVHARTVVTGYPLLDSAKTIDAAAVRAQWGLPATGPIIGCLSSPYGTVLNVAWEKAFVAKSPWRRRYWNGRWRGLKSALNPAPCEEQVMQALKQFCNHHNAPLVVKLRHTQDATPWMRKLADKIVGEESYYPHSAVELAGIASVMFGFFSTGAPEAIAAGKPFVNLGIPGYNREDWERATSMFAGMFEHPGATWTFEAANWIRMASSLPMEALTLDVAALRAYANLFCGPLDGRHAARVIHALEQLADGHLPCEIPCDDNHYVKLPRGTPI